jgi:alpha-tubulin suppressor-like RCC1 family protein
VRCWGNNLLGELGDGTLTTDFAPVVVCSASCSGPLNNIVQVSSGDYHSCAVNTAGDVLCWGSNLNGQLGASNADHCPGGAPCSAVPRVVEGLSGPARAVSATTASSCALLQAGTVECWGREFGSALTSTTPGTIEGWSDIEAIAAANGHLCAIDSEGSVLCLGGNAHGQLGDGTTIARPSGPPAQVLLLSRRGDADCNEEISSIDASLILQQVARLLDEVPCPDAAAAPEAEITALDALAVLQFSAGLLT